MFFDILLLALTLALSFCIYKIVQVQSRNSRYLRQIFDSPPLTPILGNALLFFDCRTTTDVHEKFLRLIEQFSCEPFIIWLFHKPYIVLTNHSDVQLLTSMKKREPVSNKFLAEAIGNGLTTAEDAHWKKSRNLISPCFNSSTINNSCLPTFNKQNIKFIEKLKKEIGMGKTFDVGPYILENTFSSIYETIMGIEENMDDQMHKLQNQATKISGFVSKRMYSPWLYPRMVFKLYLHAAGYSNILEEFHGYYQKKITKKWCTFNDGTTLHNKNAQESGGKPLIDVLLETHSFNNQELTDEVMSLLAASDTSGTAISFILLMLAQHQDAQEKVYQELFEIYGNDMRSPQAADLPKMIFLEQCIKETLRKYCLIPVLARQATEDITLSDGRIIPTGSNVLFVFHPLHHNPEFYPDPDTWNPHNFHPENVAKRPPNTFIPFGSGARMCVGYKYAMVLMKVFLSTFIRHFKISTDQREIKLNISVSTKSEDGYHIELTARQTNAEKI